MLTVRGQFRQSRKSGLCGRRGCLAAFEEIAGGLAYSRHLRDDLPKRENHLNLQNCRLPRKGKTGDPGLIERCSEHIDTLPLFPEYRRQWIAAY